MRSKLTIFLFSILLISCGEVVIPRPYGYYRVDLPAHQYHAIDTLKLPYCFEVSDYSQVNVHQQKGEEFWLDIHYPKLNANIYCSYKPVNGNLYSLLEDARKYVYKHSVKADGIGEKAYLNPEKRVFGILYDLKGNTASSVQFVLTDSLHHFFRGALYFNNVPNKDSIAPMSNYIRADMIRIMESFVWKK